MGALADPATAALVDRQMRNWELARSQRLAGPRTQRREVEEFVCVSRMVGVGSEIPTLLGKRLGWPVFDKQILDAMAGDDRRMRLVYESLDERGVGWWEDVLNPIIRDGLCKTVLTLAVQSPGVFVGRGLDRVLPQEAGFRVRLMASRAVRVGWYAERHGLDPAAAEGEIDRVEAERTAFLRRHYGVDAADPLRHDLVVRVDRLSPEAAVDLVERARACFRAAG